MVWTLCGAAAATAAQTQRACYNPHFMYECECVSVCTFVTVEPFDAINYLCLRQNDLQYIRKQPVTCSGSVSKNVLECDWKINHIELIFFLNRVSYEFCICRVCAWRDKKKGLESKCRKLNYLAVVIDTMIWRFILLRFYVTLCSISDCLGFYFCLTCKKKKQHNLDDRKDI